VRLMRAWRREVEKWVEDNVGRSEEGMVDRCV